MNYSTWAHMFKQLVSNDWCCLGRLWKFEEMDPWGQISLTAFPTFLSTTVM